MLRNLVQATRRGGQEGSDSSEDDEDFASADEELCSRGADGEESNYSRFGIRSSAISSGALSRELSRATGEENYSTPRGSGSGTPGSAATAAPDGNGGEATQLQPQGSAGMLRGPSRLQSSTSAGGWVSAGNASAAAEPGYDVEYIDPVTGRTVTVDKRFVVKDLNTGRSYFVAEGGDQVDLTGFSSRVQDLGSGESMTVEEFNKKLGIEGGAAQHARNSSSDANDTQDGSSSGASAPGKKGLARRVKSKLKASTKNLFASKSGHLGASFVAESSVASAAPNLAAGVGERHAAVNGSISATAAAAGPSASGANPAVCSGGSGLPVKVTSHKKLVKELTELYMVQELRGHSGVIWTMKFSRNGRYLATAGQDCDVLVWAVTRAPKPSRQQQQQQQHQPGSPSAAAAGAGATDACGSPTHLRRSDLPAEGDPAPSSSGGDAAAAGGRGADPGATGSADTGPSCSEFESDFPLLDAKPYRRYQGHKQDVLDLCWSKKEQFLLSASMDQTVRLWHISMDQCLRVFRHTDFVTALDFHPVDDRYFISGSIDGKVRVWNIPEFRVTDWADVHDMVTAAVFSRDGRRAAVGTMKGRCRFYSCEQGYKLEYEAQIDVKNKRGKQSRGRKITGLQFCPRPSASASAAAAGPSPSGATSELLVTSNDSRLRLYEGYLLKCKYKGLQNASTQIKASFSADGRYVVCGSDDGGVLVWNTASHSSERSKEQAGQSGGMASTREKSSLYECFQAFNDITTVAIFGPDCAKRCLPQPGSQAEAAPSSAKECKSSKWRTLECPEVVAAADKAISAARMQGQLIVAAGYSGRIKVFENVGAPQCS